MLQESNINIARKSKEGYRNVESEIPAESPDKIVPLVSSKQESIRW